MKISCNGWCDDEELYIWSPPASLYLWILVLQLGFVLVKDWRGGRDSFYPTLQVKPFSLVSFWLGFCFCFSFFYSWALASLWALSFPHLPLPTHTDTHTIFTEIGLPVCIVTPLSFLLTASSSLLPLWKCT